MAQAPIKRILAAIDSGDSNIAWQRFLDAYSNLLRHVVIQFEAGSEPARDCFDFVCAKLSDDDFRRLRTFDPDGPARFETWLTSVACNLCRDWRRSRYGRRRDPETIKRLSAFDRQVFDLVYRQALTLPECLQILRATLPNFVPREFHKAHARLQESLSSQQRWHWSKDRSAPAALDPDCLGSGDPGPEARCLDNEDIEVVRKALARLDPEVRLILQMRYWQDLTYREIATLLDIGDVFATRRAVDRALKSLQKAMRL